MFSHERIAAAPKGDAEKGGGVQRLSKYGRRCRGYPPLRVIAAHAVEHLYVQQLPQDIGGEAGESDAKYKRIELTELPEAVEPTFVKQHRYDIRGDQRR